MLSNLCSCKKNTKSAAVEWYIMMKIHPNCLSVMLQILLKCPKKETLVHDWQIGGVVSFKDQLRSNKLFFFLFLFHHWCLYNFQSPNILEHQWLSSRRCRKTRWNEMSFGITVGEINKTWLKEKHQMKKIGWDVIVDGSERESPWDMFEAV